MSAHRQLTLALLFACLLLASTLAHLAGQQGPARAPRGTAALVDGQPLPLALYRRDVQIYRVTLAGAHPSPDSPAWAAREQAVADRALRQAVAETIIMREAARRGLVASPAAVRAEVANMQAAAGGAAALEALARVERLSRVDLYEMARIAVLDDLLARRTHNRHLVDTLYARARVRSFVPPRAGLSGPAPAPLLGHPAPDVAAVTLADRSVTLSSLHGAPVLLTLWSIGCAWCRVEMPLLDAFARAHTGIHVIALDEGDDRSSVSAYARALRLRLQIWLDPDLAALHDVYALPGLPYTFALDRQGVIRRIIPGAVTETQTLEQALHAATG